jgi:DNA sulfur modification protein DndD
MYFTEIRCVNFGLYRGDQRIRLVADEHADITTRPIILIGGKNGAGKTTLLEAVKLCLYGAEMFGGNTNKRAYQEYLLSRIHRIPGSPLSNTVAGVGVTFVHTIDVQQETFTVERFWERTKRGVQEKLTVWQNDTQLAESDYPWWNQFLHHLLPPGLADLFFFDGEKIQSLADDPDYTTLGQAIRTLLGLDLLDRLRADLSVYMSRQKRKSGDSLDKQLADIMTKREQVNEQHEVELMKLATLRREIGRHEGKIEREEQRLASEGGHIAAKREELKQQAATLQETIQWYEREIQQHANGLLPLAVIPRLADGLRESLLAGAYVEQQQALNNVADRFTSQLLAQLDNADQWLNKVALSAQEQSTVKDGFVRLVQQVHTSLTRSNGYVPPTIHHDLSQQDRQQLLGWIEQANTEVASAMQTAGQELAKAMEELAQVEALLVQIPAEEVVQPILKHLATLNQELGALEKQREAQDAVVQQLQEERKRLQQQEQDIYTRMMRGDDPAYRMQLAASAQQALVRYEQEMRRARLGELEQRIVECYGRLSRKSNYIKHIRIDAETFETTLFNQRGDPLPREQLSAGEKQIYAIATLWALRLVSGRSIPVIVDTPLGRLDSEHRRHLVERYFPQASHQVVLLSTDTEIDAELYADLAPAVSRAYHLVYNNQEAATRVNDGYFADDDDMTSE